MKKQYLFGALLSTFLISNPAHAVPFSAQDILVNNPVAPDGIYSIDPDGPGGNAAFDIYADMTTAGGGWTLGLLSLRNDPAASTDMVSNTGTVSLSTSHTRDLSALAIDQDAQIRYVMKNNGSVIFDGYYTGNYHGTFPSAPDWTVLSGALPSTFSYHAGRAWSTVTNDVDSYSGNCASAFGGNPWYYGACFTISPVYLSQGPYVSDPNNGPFIDSWAIYVRESAIPDFSVPEPMTLTLMGLGLAGIGLARRQRLA